MSNLQALENDVDQRNSVDDSGIAAKNFVLLVIYNIVLRVGWIFKTESIIMPAILDFIGGGGWLRGCLPMLNRLGQSIPPILMSEWVRRVAFKKRLLVASAFLMGVSFLFLALVWFLLAGESPNWLPYLFLTVYGFFFFCVGVHNLTLSLLYGKLVFVTSRGRLMLIATTIGSLVAVLCAWFLMRGWLADGDGRNFLWMFMFTGLAFVFAASLAMLLTEQPDDALPDRNVAVGNLQSLLNVIASDSNFRRLAVIAGCYGVSITLVPHYQAYVRQNLGLQMDALVPWLIAQNIGAAAFSIPLGQIADRLGNRLAIKVTMLLLCAAPALTIVWLQFGEGSQVGFLVVFFLLGLTPVTMRTFSNYTLEIADAQKQPIYLSTLGACMALPVVFLSTLVGALIDRIGFAPMFLLVIAVLFIGWSLTFGLDEPRASDQLKPNSDPQSAAKN